jgi:glycosyltransferase involved in cell wall biosynthesis
MEGVMKVLHIIKTNTGASWAFNQIEKLQAMGVKVIVMLPKKDTGYALAYKELGIKVIAFDASLPVKQPWLLFSRIQRFRNIIKKINPDIIHCHFLTNIMFARIALRNVKIPRLFQVPGPLHLEYALFRKAEIVLSNDFDYWAGSCQKTCNIYRKSKIPSDRIFFGYYTSDFDQNIKNAARTGKLRKEYSIAEDTFLIGTVSYFYKPKYYLLQFKGIKGHEDFIQAFSLLNKKYPNTKGVIIGGPAPKSVHYMHRLMKMAKKKCGDNLIFTGFHTDLSTIYPDLDLAVHPSRSENYGGCCESISYGVPTLTTDVGGFPDFIKDKKTGYMVPAANPIKLAKKMEYVIKNYDKAKQVTVNGQNLIKTINSELSAKQAFYMYETILDPTKRIY